jgi:hypothetical protein
MFCKLGIVVIWWLTVDAEAKKKLIEIVQLARGSILYFWAGGIFHKKFIRPAYFF